MTRWFFLACAFAILLVAVSASDAAAYWPRGGYRYSYHYGGFGGGYAHYNSWNGGFYHGGFGGYNGYTGRYGGSRSFYNPYTGRYGSVQAGYNPYTNRYAYHYSYGDGW
jgi:hypothetical protein